MPAASGWDLNSVAPENREAIGFQGNIAVIALDNIFQLIDLAALSGKLEIRSQENDGNFYFSGGVFVHGTLSIHPRRIGAILIENGLLTEEQLQECLQLHGQSGQPQPLGEILLEKGYVAPEHLDASLERQVKEAFFETLAWQEGTFAYYPGEKPAASAPQLQERVDHLLLEGMIYLDTLVAA